MLNDVDQRRIRVVVVVVVAFAAPASLRGHQHRQRLDGLLVLSDPGRHAYRAFGFGRGTVLRVWLDARVWVRSAQLLRRGGRPVPANEDTLQLGGDALLDAEGQIA